MNDHELRLRLLAIATLAASPAVLVDVFSEPIEGTHWRLYTVELVGEAKTRWFGLHGEVVADEPGTVLLRELSRQFDAPAALAPPA